MTRLVAALAVACCAWSAPEQPPAVRPSTVVEVETALEHDPALLQNHRGLLACLAQHTELAHAEAAWIGLCRRADVGPVAREFDEALAAAPETERLFDACYDALAKDADLRAAVETIFRTQFNQPATAKPTANVFAYLRAHPEFAARFLANPRAEPDVPDDVRPYMNEFLEDDSGLAATLRTPLATVSGSPLGQRQVLPWWQCGLAENGANAYANLLDHFARYPDHFRVWHEHELALAADGNTRQWVRYWCRRTRRTAALARGYLDYLDNVAYDPAYRQRKEAEWTQRFGAAEPWPPNAAPPPLEGEALALPEEFKRPEAKRPEMPSMKSIPSPKREAPTRPEIPAMPTIPSKPGKQ